VLGEGVNDEVEEDEEQDEFDHGVEVTVRD
jgi:hypothetical protein